MACSCQNIIFHSLSKLTGVAVVTLDRAALWTDGRYFLQAEMELDCNWILQKEGRMPRVEL